MSLGTTISRLSQGDLAEALGVSRQSVSKWETDASVPDLDKLVKLSQLFGVTLDQLVTGTPPEPAPDSPDPPRTPRQPFPPRKIAGTILLCMAFLVVLVLTSLGGILEGLLLAAPFVLCALVCFLAKRHPGLWCGWTLYVCAQLVITFCTSLRWRFLFQPSTYQYYSGLHFILAFVQIGCMAALATGTAVTFRSRSAPGKPRLLAGWGLWMLLHLPLSAVVPLHILTGWGHYLFATLMDIARLGLFAALLTATVCLLRSRKPA